jgi:small conductance mechanosensitive channel
VVEIAGKGGLVEEVTLRYVRLRDADGHVHFIPNGEIKVVTNRTRGFATTVVDVGIGYRENVDEGLAVMREVGAAMRKDPKWSARIVEDVEIIGLDKLDSSAVVLRCRLKVVPPIEQWNVKREYMKRLKAAYDERGIEIPYPHVTVYAGQNKDGSAPPFHVVKEEPGTPAEPPR